MSKQKSAKEVQNYNPKPVFPMCSNCIHYTSDIVKPYPDNDYLQEKNIRCGIGGFAVKKNGTCNNHQMKILVK